MQEIKRYTKEEVRAASLDYFKRSPLFVSGMTDDDYLLPANVFANKYAERDRAGNYTELTPDDMHRRLARKFAEAEAKSANPMSEDEIFLLLQFFGPVVPQGSPMMAIGNRFQLVSTSNCKVLPAPQDTMSAIFGIGRDMANLYKRRAGVGTDLSLLRPAGASVNNAAITSTGAYSFGEFYSNITRMVGQNGRRGALMLTMDVRHPDIEQFITMKADLTKVTGANVSVKMTDEFMRAVEADEEYTLRWPVDARVEDAKTTKVVRAKEVFKLIAEMACNNAEPGLLFWNTIELNLPLNYYAGFEVISTNPCGEIPLCAHDSCRLISIYLPHFVKRKFSRDAYFDFNEFHDVVTKAMRLSDDLVEIEIEHLSALRDKADTADERELFAKFVEKCQQGRRTGLGTHGLADALAQLRVRYDSEDGVGAADTIYNRFKLSAYAASVKLAKERGPFPMFDWETEKECAFIQRLPQWLQNEIQKYGRRNGSLLTNAPTGSTSIESGNCSSGIEPVFANWYYRNMKIDAARETTTPDHTDAMGDGWKRFKVYHPNILRYLKLAHAQPLKYDLPQPEQADLPWEQFVEEAELPEYFVTANDIDYMKRVEMQGAIQQHIDHSISSTINLPKETKPEAVEAIYLEAWKRGLKGVTVYRDGSRESQVLSTETKAEPTKKVKEVEQEIPYWPYCPYCKEPMDFDKEEPFAYCACGPTEWGYPRPAPWVHNPAAWLKTNHDLIEEIASMEAAWPASPVCEVECKKTTHRGASTAGDMTKATFHDVNGRERKVYVYVGVNDEGQPVEVFITDERGDEELKPYAAALGKMTSLGLKHGVPAAAITKTLGGLKGGSVSYGEKTYESVPDFVSKLLAKVTEQTTANARREKLNQMLANPGEPRTILWEGSDVPDVYSSVADEMKKTVTGHDGVLSVNGRAIEISPALSAAYSVKLADVLAKATTTPTTIAITGAVGKPVVDVPRQGEKCQECEQWAVFKVDGCPTCKNCGWGKCT